MAYPPLFGCLMPSLPTLSAITLLVLTSLHPVTSNDSHHQAHQHPSQSDLVDKVESIEAQPTQLTIITTKPNASSSAPGGVVQEPRPGGQHSVSIRVMDLQSGTELPASNYSGPLLSLIRGRYTVGFLQPCHWYGVVFRSEYNSENPPAGGGGVAVGQPGGYVNEEYHLAMTLKEELPPGLVPPPGDANPAANHHLFNASSMPYVSVFTRRFGSGGKSLENLVVTAKWEAPPEARPNFDAVINLTLFCEEDIKHKIVRLRSSDNEKSVEVKLDNTFDTTETNNQSGRMITASITPKNCARLCWSSELVAEPPAFAPYSFRRRAAPDECEKIATVKATAHLRSFVGYEMHPTTHALIVHTNYTAGSSSTASSGAADHQNSNNNNEPDAYVMLSAVELPHGAGGKAGDLENKSISKLFSTDGHSNDFELDGLVANSSSAGGSGLYAVQYTYGKESPFAYAESRRFIVGRGGAADLPPVNLTFHLPSQNSGNSSTNATTTEEATHSAMRTRRELSNEEAVNNGTNGTAPNVNKAPKKYRKESAIEFRLEPAYTDYELGIDVEPPCRESQGESTPIQSSHNNNANEKTGQQQLYHFWLTRDHPSHEVPVPERGHCSRPAMQLLGAGSNGSQAPTSSSSAHQFCFTPSLRMPTAGGDEGDGGEKIYTMERQCADMGELHARAVEVEEMEANATRLALEAANAAGLPRSRIHIAGAMTQLTLAAVTAIISYLPSYSLCLRS